MALLLLSALLAAMVASLHVGLRTYDPDTIWRGLTGGTETDEIIVRSLRLPRTLIAITAGASLALSGLIMQAATRNPLAEPGLLGTNAGAAFAVTVGLSVFGYSGLLQVGGFAILGALVTTAVVFALTLRLGPNAGRATILLVGVTIAAMLASLTQILLLVDETALETLLFWLSGGFADRDLRLLWLGCGLLGLVLVGLVAIAGSIDALQLDDASARGIGVDAMRTRMLALGAAALLAAGAVAMAGPVMFLGLVAPHMAMRLTRRRPAFLTLAGLTMLSGALVAVLADILARLIVAPGEAPIGAVLAIIGVPVLIALLRKRGARAA